MTDEAALRRIAIAMIEGIDASASNDSKRLHQRYLRHMRLHPESSFTDASIEARIGFIAEVLESPAVPWFVCPVCSGNYFGSTFENVDGRIFVTERQCHDELGVGCRWRGAAT